MTAAKSPNEKQRKQIAKINNSKQTQSKIY